MNINKVILVGKVKSKKVATGTTGIRICNLIVVTTKNWSDQASGEIKERNEWHRVVAYGNVALKADMIQEGDEVYVEGSLRTREIISSNNDNSEATAENPTKVTEVVANRLLSESIESKGSEMKSNNFHSNDSDEIPF